MSSPRNGMRAYPTISQMWRRNWEHLTPFFAYPADIRKVIYTTNAVESLNMSLRKVIKTRGSFPNQEAALKLLYLALGTHRQKMDHAGAELEGRLAALRDPARRPRRRRSARCYEESEQEHFSGWGAAPKPPRFIAFAPGFLDREASCARTPGIPAPESALGLRLRRALPSAQVRSVYQG